MNNIEGTHYFKYLWQIRYHSQVYEKSVPMSAATLTADQLVEPPKERSCGHKANPSLHTLKRRRNAYFTYHLPFAIDLHLKRRRQILFRTHLKAEGPPLKSRRCPHHHL